MPKYKIGDRLCLKRDNSHKNLIIDIRNDRYYVEYWNINYVNRVFQSNHSFSIYDDKDEFILDKEYIWNKQMKEIINE